MMFTLSQSTHQLERFIDSTEPPGHGFGICLVVIDLAGLAVNPAALRSKILDWRCEALVALFSI